MKKRKLSALQLNKKSISVLAKSGATGGDDDITALCFTRMDIDACNTKDVFRCNTGDRCHTVVGCPSFIRC
jgi:hypothetical protein